MMDIDDCSASMEIRVDSSPLDTIRCSMTTAADHEDRIGVLERLVDELRAKLAGLLGRGSKA